MPATLRHAAPTQQADLADPRLIVALDLPTRAEAEDVVEALGDAVSFYKIGLQLFATDGMAMARDLRARGRSLFLDWKLHDIGATVEKAAAAIVGTGACDLLTVHAHPQVLKAAVKGRGGDRQAKILGVTVLTSLNGQDLAEMGYGMGVEALVERRIRQVQDAGADGVVASPHEAAMARRIGGPDFLVVTPGVRPEWAGKDDQARAATPAEALANGASHLVIGRPVTAAADPREAALRLAAEMRGGA
ncbi:MAG: orotidine-5'-phosphate decarboxylase [Proteobacteria bacterium]|nr:orotidine-5'-phosphate decarboxylase [Pseudomonadota bacterium]